LDLGSALIPTEVLYFPMSHQYISNHEMARRIIDC
jgi:hypothetical protein